METPEGPAKTLTTEARVLCALATAFFFTCLARAALGSGSRPLEFYQQSVDLGWALPFTDRPVLGLFMPASLCSLVCVALAVVRPEFFGRLAFVRAGVLTGALTALAVSAWVLAAVWEYGRAGGRNAAEGGALIVLACAPALAYLVWAFVRDRFGAHTAALSLLAFLTLPVIACVLLGLSGARIRWNYEVEIAAAASSPFWAFAAQAALRVWLVRHVAEGPTRRWERALTFWTWMLLVAAPFACVVVMLAWPR